MRSHFWLVRKTTTESSRWRTFGVLLLVASVGSGCQIGGGPPDAGTTAPSQETTAPTQEDCASALNEFIDYAEGTVGEASARQAALESLDRDFEDGDILQEVRTSRYGLFRSGVLIAVTDVFEAPAGGWLASWRMRCDE
jgi:hypothetical protein